MEKKTETLFMEKADSLAREILGLTRSAMFVKLRFLDAALGQLPFSRRDGMGHVATDGKHLFYDPRFILQRYEESPDRLARDCLHLVFHCVLHHPFFVQKVHPAWWNLAVDIAVENALNELDVFPTGRVHEAEAEQVLADLRGRAHTLTAEGLYRLFAREGMDDDDASNLRRLFYHDNHVGWYATPKQEENAHTGDQNVGEQGQTSGDDTGGSGDNKADSQNRMNKEGAGGGDGQPDTGQPQQNGADTPQGEHGNAPPESSPGGQGNGQDEQRDDGSSAPEKETGGTSDGDDADGEAGGKDGGEDDAPMKYPAPREDGLFPLWKQISRRMQTDLETTSRRWGEESGDLLQSIRGANRDKCDYSAFLRRFAIRGEQMKVNDDEFDYIFYTYGLQHYGNMPLIEPLEYKEVRKVREFVIAIDTSASCSGELVQGFIRKTYSILKQQECFFRRLNIHILQCDAELQSDVLITNEGDLERYIAEQELHGFGGTDFRPVFAYVDELIAKHAFFDLRGLIYFSDGYGVFPEKKPPYDTAFIFLDDDESHRVPSWVIPVRMTEEELYDLIEQPPKETEPAASAGGDEKQQNDKEAAI